MPPEWAIGRLRRARAPRTAALSAAFAREARRAPIAIMDIRAWGRRGVAAGPHAVVVAAPHAVAEAARAAVVAARAVAAVVDIDRSESCEKPI